MKKINIEQMSCEELERERDHLSKISMELLSKYGVFSDELFELEKKINDKIFEIITGGK